MSTWTSNNPCNVWLLSPPKCNRHRHSNTRRTTCSFKLCILPYVDCKYQWRSQKVLSNPVETVCNVAKLWKEMSSHKAWRLKPDCVYIFPFLQKNGKHFWGSRPFSTQTLEWPLILWRQLQKKNVGQAWNNSKYENLLVVNGYIIC